MYIFSITCDTYMYFLPYYLSILLIQSSLHLIISLSLNLIFSGPYTSGGSFWYWEPATSSFICIKVWLDQRSTGKNNHFHYLRSLQRDEGCHPFQKFCPQFVEPLRTFCAWALREIFIPLVIFKEVLHLFRWKEVWLKQFVCPSIHMHTVVFH